MEKAVSRIELLEAMRQQGLPAITAFLQKRLKKEWVLLDDQGKVIYTSSAFHQPADLGLVLSTGISELYKEKSKKFIRCLADGSPGLIVAVADVSQDEIEPIRGIFDTAGLAAMFYLQSQQEAHRRFTTVETNFMEQLFGSGDRPKNDFLSLGHFNLNNDKPYVIQLIHLIGEVDRKKANRVVERMVLYTESNHLPSMRPIYWRGDLVHIIPALYKSETFELRKEWPELRVSEVFREIVAKELAVDLAIGIGRIYPLCELDKSYREARIALAFKGVLQEGGYVQRFADMGFFRYIFSRGIEENKRDVYGLLGPIIDYDNQKNANFLKTLRILLDSGLNWKKTAEKCGVHVNTIYYRIECMEKLLDRDLQSAENKFELFVALKIWDVLNTLGAVDDAYVGLLDKTAGKNGKE